MIELRWWLPCSEFSWAVWPMPGSLYETHFSNSSLNLLENQQVSISIPTTDGLREHQRMLVGQWLEGHFNGSARAGFRCNYLPPPIYWVHQQISSDTSCRRIPPNLASLHHRDNWSSDGFKCSRKTREEAPCSNWLMHVYLTPHLTSFDPTWVPRFFWQFSLWARLLWC